MTVLWGRGGGWLKIGVGGGRSGLDSAVEAIVADEAKVTSTAALFVLKKCDLNHWIAIKRSLWRYVGAICKSNAHMSLGSGAKPDAKAIAVTL